MYKHLLKSQGVELVFLKLPKTDTILDPIIESLMEAFDEFHSQKSKIDGLRGMRENIKQGWRAGGKAILGYKLDKQIVGSREGQPLTKSKLVADVKTFGEIQMYLKGRARGSRVENFRNKCESRSRTREWFISKTAPSPTLVTLSGIATRNSLMVHM